MRTAALVFVVSTVGLVGGCSKGVSYGDPTTPTGSQMQAVSSLGDINTSVTTSVKGMATGDSVFNVYSLMANIQGTATSGASQTSGLTFNELGLPAACVTGDAATGFTYNNCDYGSGTTLNGTVMITTSSVAYDLTIAVAQSGVTDQTTLKGTVNDSAGRITGSLDYKTHVGVDGLGGLGGTSVDTSVSADWDIGYTEEPACITDGTIEVQADQGQGLHGARFLFMGCGNVQVQNG